MLKHENTRKLLKGYAAQSLKPTQNAMLISGLKAWYRSLDRSSLHARHFEVILNRYIILNPLKLTEVGALIGKTETNVGRDVREGIRLLSEHLSAVSSSG